MPEDKCPECHNSMPRSADTCPHCARPGRYPNVLDAEETGEKAELNRLYSDAVSDAKARGAESVLLEFEGVVAASQAVIARPYTELQRLAVNDDEIYVTFYDLTESGVRLPRDDSWARQRRAADITLFANYYEKIRFACLSTDGLGLENYGGCFLRLREDLIAHRASTLTDNAVFFLIRHGVNPVEKDINLPLGHRATWEDRAKLCVAKLAGELTATTPRSEFADLLMKNGADTGKDSFVEVHICGSMTRRTLESVTIKRMKSARKDVILRETVEALEDADVTVNIL